MNDEVIYGLAGMAFAILFLALVVVVIVAVIKVWQTKIQTAKEEVYQKLALDAIEAQKTNNILNEKLVEELAEVKNRLISVERILKEVE